MALDDINFQEGEGQDYLVEVPAGTLNAPLDALVGQDGQALLAEIPALGNVFILSE